MMTGIQIRIDAADLIGLTRSPGGPADSDAQVYRTTHVAVQRPRPPRRPTAQRCPLRHLDAGPHHPCHADRHRRKRPLTTEAPRRPVHLPLVGHVDESGTSRCSAPKLLRDAAVRTGRLYGRLGLIDARGGPLCGRVVPPALAWSAAPAG
ncbi:DUF5990 family protein [Streptomyces sviceus]|uniref:DUF5990 family protein n=1 Tax=Streptomyces sviceus TaxID=285530 RepID=UPI0036E8AE4A